ncbi:hypothetical protein E3U35_09610 [Histophilus somni]|nr:hypothetical protein E3U35_09610 [Histophilus somni]
MKKILLLSALSLSLFGCGDEQGNTTNATTENVNTEQVAKAEETKKAIMPEEYLKDVAFTKNERGTVIFGNLQDMLANMTDYNIEDKTLKIISENPLSIQIFYKSVANQDTKYLKSDIEDRFINAIFKIFTHTNIDEISVEIIPIDHQTNKPLHKKFNLKTKITRAKALEILNAYSSAKVFDDLVNFAENEQYNVIGYSGSKLSLAIRDDKVREYVAKALTTGNIKIPIVDVQLPLDVNFTDIQVKLKKVFDLSLFDNDKRKLSDGSFEYSTTVSDYVKVYAIGDDNKVIKQVAVQFVLVNDQDIIDQSIGGVAVAMLATPNPDKSFRIVNTMLDKVGKKLKKLKKAEGSIEETKVVDGLTIKLKAYPQLGGIAFLTIEKLAKKEMVFE